jgi:hypothetical protein
MPKSPRAVGYVVNFVKANPSAAEERWKRSEDRLPEVYRAIANRSLLSMPKLIEVAKECIALHAVRSRTRIRIHEHVKLTSHAKLLEQLKLSPEAIDEYAEREADRVMALIDQDTEFFQERVMINLDDLVDRLERTSIQVVETGPGAGEFLIADDPSPSLKVGHHGLGPLGGVPFPEATTIPLPLSPQICLALRDEPSWLIADAHAVMVMNRVQLSNAERRVFYAPASGLREAVARSVEPREARPESPGPTIIDWNG